MTAQIIATESMESAGAIVYWRLNGDVDHAVLTQLWEDAGLDKSFLPELPTPVVALQRAVAELRQGRTLVRAIATAKWGIVAEKAQEGSGTRTTTSTDENGVPVVVTIEGQRASLDYRHDLTITLSPSKEQVVVETASGGAASPELQAQLQTSFEAHGLKLNSIDISSWLAKLAPRCNAVVLRDMGGVYFIPPAPLVFWRRAVAVLRACSAHRVFEVPAMRSEEAVAAILDAVTREAENTAKGMQEELDGAQLGKKAVVNRQADCDKLEAKLTAYEKLLGCSLTTIHTQLGKLRANLAEALITIGGDDKITPASMFGGL